MHLIPKPKKVEVDNGIFTIDLNTTINLLPQRGVRFAGEYLVKGIQEHLGFSIKRDGYYRSNQIHLVYGEDSTHGEGYALTINDHGITIKANEDSGIYYGVMTLLQLIQQYKRRLPYLRIVDEPDYPERGFYYDVTRGKIPTLKTLKGLVDKASFYKLNQLQLYVEHTFAYEGQSEVWSCTDPLTADEIIELDTYCKERHVELVPSISTFGHLYEALRSKSFSHLCELDESEEPTYNWVHRMMHHTLDVANPESIDFVSHMIEQYIPLFSSNKFNICADETFDLGKGKNKAYCEEVGTSKMYVDFLNQIIDIVKFYDKEVMFWGDIIIKHPEYIKDLPKDLVCLNWWYWGDYEEEKVKIIADHGFPQYLCPGTSGWNNIMNNHKGAYENIKSMARMGQKYNARGILNTDWGDFGHFNLQGNSLPGLIYGANFSWNTESYALEDLNTAIDLIEFNLESKDSMTAVLNDIHECQKMNIDPVVHWLHHNNLKRLEEQSINNDDIKGTIERLAIIEDKLLDALHKVPNKKHQDVREYLVATEGVRLFNMLIPAIRNNVMGEELELLSENEILAVDLEYWLVNYKEVWRQRNKESELYRITQFIRTICGRLRQW